MTALASLADLPAADALAQWLAARTPANDDTTADPADQLPAMPLAAVDAAIVVEEGSADPEDFPQAAPEAQAIEAAALADHDDVLDEGMRCRTLWLAVLAQAIEDERREPTGYIGSPSFNEVCGLAGIEPEWAVRKLADLPKDTVGRRPVVVRNSPKPLPPKQAALPKPQKPSPRGRPRQPRPVNRDFAIFLADARKKAGLTQAKAAALLGISQGQVAHWEVARTMPDAARQAAVLDLLRARAGSP